MNTKKMIKRIKSNKFGRILSRIVGEDTGAVMMEYVLVAMLVAAATVAALAYFGRDTQGMFGVLGKAIYGRSEEAADKTEIGAEDSGRNNEQGQQKAMRFTDSAPDTSGL